MESSVFNPNFDTPSKHLTNKEKAEITYKALQKRKLNKAKSEEADFNDYKKGVCAKAKKKTHAYR